MDQIMPMRLRNFLSVPIQLRLGLFLAGGLMVTLGLTLGLMLLRIEPSGQATTLEAVADDEARSISIENGFGVTRVTMQYTIGLSWAPRRAVGPPDTRQMGDIPSAWASLTADGQAEWLELDYESPVVPTLLRVYENHGPGAIVRVIAFDAAGSETVAWEGKDPAAQKSDGGVYVAEIPLQLSHPIQRVRIHLDSVAVPNWNEIDAAALVEADGTEHWAVDARASSTYAPPRGNPTLSFEQLHHASPAWARFEPGAWSEAKPSANQVVELARRDARGWPMRALWGTQRAAPAAPVAISRVSFVPAAPPPPLTLVYRPIWRGLLVNSLFWGAVLLLLYAATVGLRRFIRQSLWLRRGCCMRCGYDLRFDLLRGCPECGWRRDAAANQP